MSRQFRVRFIAALLAMQAVTVVAIIVVGAMVTRPALVDQMSRLMDRQATSAANQASARLAAQRRVAQQAADLMAAGTVPFDDDAAIEELLRTGVVLDEGTYALYVGRSDGSIVYVGRDVGDQPGALTRTWLIDVDPSGARRTTYVWRDAAGAVVATAEDPADTFDPRTRPWYRAAEAAGQAVWTDPYVFVTTREPGVTAATPLAVDGEVVGVVGLDLGLAELSAVVDDIDVSENGRAILLQDDGTLVAHPVPTKVVVGEGEEVRNATIGEVDDPVSQAGYESLRAAGKLDDPAGGVGGPSPSTTTEGESEAGSGSIEVSEVFEVEGETYQVVVEPLGEPEGWFVAITAPESDFVGEIQAAERQTALIAVIAGLAVVVLAMPLVRLVSRRFSRLHQRANVDALTGLVNRHVFGEALEREVARAASSDGRRRLCAAQIDVDFFKHVNDAYGHAAGDQALTVVASRLAHGVRERDVVARLGGDEFAVLLVDADEEEAAEIMERVRASIEAEPVETADGSLVPITITVGIAQLPAGDELAALAGGTRSGAGEDGSGEAASVGEALMDLADQGLYVAKEHGRNKVATRDGVRSGGADPVGTPR